MLVGLSLCSFHQEGCSFRESHAVLAVAWAKKTKRKRDSQGLFLGDIGSSTLVCNGSGDQGRDAVNQTSLSPFYKVVSKKENILASKMHQEFASAGAQIPHCLPVSLSLARRLVLE